MFYEIADGEINVLVIPQIAYAIVSHVLFMLVLSDVLVLGKQIKLSNPTMYF